jgi:hypothetical protein
MTNLPERLSYARKDADLNLLDLTKEINHS